MVRAGPWLLMICAMACGRFGFDSAATGTDAEQLDSVGLDGISSNDGSFNDVGLDAANLDYCSAVPHLAADPLIDGVLEPGLTTTAILPLWSGPGSVPAGVSARYAAAWRPDRLYLYVDVTDPDRFPAAPGDHPFCGDGVELFVDSDGNYPAARLYDNPGASQLIVGAPPTGAASVARGEVWRSQAHLGAWASSAFRAFSRPGGYVVEAAVVAADLGLASWAISGNVGLDVGIDVSTSDGSPGTFQSVCTGGGIRLGQLFLRITTPTGACSDGGPYCDVRAFCSPAVL